MTKRIILAVASAAMLGTSAMAQDEAPIVIGAVGADVATAYIFRGATENDEVNVQPYIEATAYGIVFGTWANFNTDTEQFDEIDYYLSYDIPMPEDVPVGVSVGYTEYTYPTATSMVGTNTVGLEANREIGLGLSLDTILAPSLGFYYGVDGGIDQSLYIEGSVGHSIEVTEDVAVDASAALGYVDPDSGESGFSHCTISLGSGYGSVSFSINYVIETDSDVLEVDEDFFFVIGAGF